MRMKKLNYLPMKVRLPLLIMVALMVATPAKAQFGVLRGVSMGLRSAQTWRIALVYGALSAYNNYHNTMILNQTRYGSLNIPYSTATITPTNSFSLNNHERTNDVTPQPKPSLDDIINASSQPTSFQPVVSQETKMKPIDPPVDTSDDLHINPWSLVILVAVIAGMLYAMKRLSSSEVTTPTVPIKTTPIQATSGLCNHARYVELANGGGVMML